jgi:siroheme synthase-like protein
VGTYPIFLEMKDRRCVVIGGGAVAERKVEGILAAGAKVTVVSPALNGGLQRLLSRGAIRHLPHEHRAGDLAGYDLAFVAMDDPELNAAACGEARSQNIWVNSADDPAHCDFLLPAVIRRGDLVVAVSTGGASPAATRAMREELDEYFTADYARFVQIAAEVRRELREKSVSPSADAWNRALRGDFRRLIKEGKAMQAKELLLEKLGAKS